jgi:hypothetical protein
MSFFTARLTLFSSELSLFANCSKSLRSKKTLSTKFSEFTESIDLTVQNQNVCVCLIAIVVDYNLRWNFAVADFLEDIFLTNLDEALEKLVKFHFYDRG